MQATHNIQAAFIPTVNSPYGFASANFMQVVDQVPAVHVVPTSYVRATSSAVHSVSFLKFTKKHAFPFMSPELSCNLLLQCSRPGLQPDAGCVLQADTAITLTSSADNTVYGEEFNLTATIAAVAPSTAGGIPTGQAPSLVQHDR